MKYNYRVQCIHNRELIFNYQVNSLDEIHIKYDELFKNWCLYISGDMCIWCTAIIVDDFTNPDVKVTHFNCESVKISNMTLLREVINMYDKPIEVYIDSNIKNFSLDDKDYNIKLYKELSKIMVQKTGALNAYLVTIKLVENKYYIDEIFVNDEKRHYLSFKLYSNGTYKLNGVIL